MQAAWPARLRRKRYISEGGPDLPGLASRPWSAAAAAPAASASSASGPLCALWSRLDLVQVDQQRVQIEGIRQDKVPDGVAAQGHLLQAHRGAALGHELDGFEVGVHGHVHACIFKYMEL